MHHVGLVCGTFDLLHAGHLALLWRARDLCDVLVVGVYDGPDSSKTRALTAHERIVDLLATRIPDVVQSYVNPLDVVMEVRPDVVVQGDDWLDTGPHRDVLVRHLGDRLRLVPRTPGVSSAERRAAAVAAHARNETETGPAR